MTKKLLIILLIVVVAGGAVLGYLWWQTRGLKGEVSKVCVEDSDCVSFGEMGWCNCGCYNKDYLPTGSGGECFCAPPESCICVEGQCQIAPPTDETANWKTYRNEEYEFEVKYPEDWKHQAMAEDIIRFTTEDDLEPTGADNFFEVSVWRTEHTMLAAEDWVKQSLLNDKLSSFLVVSETPMVINGIKGYRLAYDLSRLDCPSGKECAEGIQINNFFVHNSRIYQIVFIDGEYGAMFNQMLSTFRFIEDEDVEDVETDCEKWRKECAKEGEIHCTVCGCRNCCFGSVSRYITHPMRTKDNEVVCVENMTMARCVKCGDGICGESEDWCICPEDCNKPNPEDLELCPF